MKIRKFVSFALAFVMLASSLVFDSKTALANLQTPVSTLKLTDDHIDGSEEYRLSLSWDEPEISTAQDTSSSYISDPDGGVVKGYNVYFTKGRYPKIGSDTKQAELPAATRKWNIPADKLESGSVYAFTTEPFHNHTYRVYANGVESAQNRYAPFDTGKPSTKSELFMTDLQVSASGSGSQITVTWDRPIFDNKVLFDRYYLYYGLGSANPDNPAIVSVSDPSVTLVDGKYSYTIHNANGESFDPGDYELRLEPIVGTDLAPPNRKLAQYISRIDHYVWLSQNLFTANFKVVPSLYVHDADSENIKIYWDSLQRFSSKIASLIIETSTSSTFATPPKPVTILSLSNDAVAKSTTTTYMKKPEEKTYFRLTIIDEFGKPHVSNIVEYDPTQEKFTPTKPIIVSAIPNDSLPISIDLTWEAFKRLPYTKEEIELTSDKDKEIVDEGVKYTIWITDDVLNFSDSAFNDQYIKQLEPKKILDLAGPDAALKYYYNYVFDQYATLVDGAYKLVPLVDNKIYYFRIIAERTQVDLASEYGYYSCFVKPIGDINIAPIMLSRPPLRVKTINNVEVIDTASITVEWETSWYEVYDPATASWYSRFDFDSGLVFGEDVSDTSASAIELRGSIYGSDEQKGIADIKLRLKTLAGLTDAELAMFPVRYMNLSGSQYDIAVVPYSSTSEAGFETFLTALNANASAWKGITPAAGSSTLEYKVTNTTLPAGALSSDTSYIILVRPYTMKNGQKLAAHYPAYLIASTLAVRTPVDIVPTVPSLSVTDVQDQSVTVKFKYVAGLSYELAYSELLLKDPGTGKVIANEELLKNGKITGPDAKGDYYLEYKILKLFPETTYYFWVRSIAKNASGTVSSQWSNPVNAKTKEIDAPATPQGLGLASEAHVDTYNKQNTTEYFPIDVGYIIVEWYKNINDTASSTAATGTKSELLLLPDFPETYMAKFSELIGNKPYWFRIKARLTVTKTASGAEPYYQYIIQMSPDDSFVDVVELTVPSTLASIDPVYTRVKESAWSTPIRLVTGRYKGEYDGDKNPNLYPLPTSDFETIYDKVTDTLTLRFLSDKTDANGNHDNLVDQRFISSLIASKTYTYNVNMAFYNNKTVKNRKLELPYQIVKAFADRKITLTITTDSSVYKLPPNFFDTNQLKALKNLGTGSYVTIYVNNDSSGLPVLESATQSFASPAQKLSVAVATPSASVKLSYTKSPADIALTLSNRYVTRDKNTGSFTFNPDQKSWQRNTDSYDKATNELKFSTSFISAYAAIASSVPVSLDSNAADNMYEVATKIEMKGLGHYDPKAAAPALYLNKIITAVAKNSLVANVTENLSDDEYNSLSKAGMLVTGGNVTREAGISALVKLYELKTKSSIKNIETETSTSFIDIKTADTKYRTALLKAAEIGFFDSEKARPKDNLTMAEMINMLNIIIQDSGL